MSAQNCGCDPEENNHHCDEYPKCTWGRYERELIQRHPSSYVVGHPPGGGVPLRTQLRLTSDFSKPLPKPAAQQGLFPADAQGRKDHPVFTGVLMYFPDAIAAVARVSKKGNDQHNPGEPLHWAREKSTDQLDTATRHSMDHGVGVTKDTDGEYHLAKAIWRLCAELQLTIEKERA